MKLLKACACAVVLIAALSFTAYGQSYSSYYYDYKLLNPALVGMKDKHIITTVYAGVPSVAQSSLVYASYETSLPSIKSGIGAMTSYTQLGVFDILQNSVFFSKQLALDEKSGLRLGTRLTYRRNKVDYDYYQPIDDPGYFDEVTNSFNMDLGLLYYSRVVNIGVAVNELLKEDLQLQHRIFNVLVSHEFNIGSSLKFTPSVVYFNDIDWDENWLHINSIFEIKRLVLIGAGCVFVEGKDDVTFTAGLNIKDWVQVIGHVYSSARQRLSSYTDSRIEVMIRASIPHHREKK